jgi:hypothetical protein
MQRINHIAEHEMQARPDGATLKQCQTVWALMNLCNMEPVWVSDKTKQEATTLITLLYQIKDLQKQLNTTTTT